MMYGSHRKRKRRTPPRSSTKTVISGGRGRSDETPSPIGTAENGEKRGRQRSVSLLPADARARPRDSGSARNQEGSSLVSPMQSRTQHPKALPTSNKTPKRMPHPEDAKSARFSKDRVRDIESESSEQDSGSETDEMVSIQILIPKTKRDGLSFALEKVKDLGGQIVEKRRYDSAKFADVFQDGQNVHAKLMNAGRTYFFIYLDIFEDSWKELICKATNCETISTHTREYDIACRRLQEWRRNWWSRVMIEAKRIQLELMTENGWNELPDDALLGVYAKKFSADYICQLFEKINSHTVNFHESLAASAKCRQVYKHLFPQIMKMLHIHRCRPIEFTQEKCYAYIRGAAAQLVQFGYTPCEIFVFWPRKGPSQRENKRIRQVDVSQDPDFEVPELSEDEGGDSDRISDESEV